MAVTVPVEPNVKVAKVVVGRPIRRVTPGQFLISALSDVDVSTLQDGSVLVYNDVTGMWESTTLLNEQVVDGGTY